MSQKINEYELFDESLQTQTVSIRDSVYSTLHVGVGGSGYLWTTW